MRWWGLILAFAVIWGLGWLIFRMPLWSPDMWVLTLVAWVGMFTVDIVVGDFRDYRNRR